jgi:DNA-binding beta-propeller fold protein YncE
MIQLVRLVALSLLVCSSMIVHVRSAEPVGFTSVGSFGKFPDDVQLGPTSAVAVNRQGEVYIFHRGKRPIIVCDSQGNVLRSWGDDLIGSAHGLRLDRDENVWVTDIGNHRVFKFDPQGKLLLTLGTGKPGDALDQFNKPTDLAFGPQGEVYVTDGYGNGRVMKFSPSGALIQTWGKIGKSDGEFRIPHSIVIDRQGRLLVGDRENDRIQVFDVDGKLLAIWPGYAPYGLAFDAAGRLFLADGRARQVLQLDENGQVVARLGRPGKADGEFELPHMLAFDRQGDLLVAEIGNNRLQKWVRK